MTPNLLTGNNVIVQGITGTHGTFHTRSMIEAGTAIVAGVTPGKGGEYVDQIPVFNSIKEVQAVHTVDISVVFVPAKFARAAILESIEAEVPLIVCITEGMPVHDMLYIKQRIKDSGKKSTLIGPNCPGILMPGVHKLGIIPANMGLPGSGAIVSRSGTLTYEAMASLTAHNIGQKYIVGIGGDPIRGSGFIETLDLFERDNDVSFIVLIGEIGGTDEQKAAEYIHKHISKPVFAYVAGHSAPPGVQLGHAGAILGSTNESAQAKTESLREAGAHTAESITELIRLVVEYESQQ